MWKDRLMEVDVIQGRRFVSDKHVFMFEVVGKKLTCKFYDVVAGTEITLVSDEDYYEQTYAYKLSYSDYTAVLAKIPVNNKPNYNVVTGCIQKPTPDIDVVTGVEMGP